METTAQPPTRDPGASFRDPGGAVFRWDDRIFRVVNALGEDDLAAFLNAPACIQAVDRGQIAATRRLCDAETRSLLSHPEIRSLFDRVAGTILLEHQCIAFPSFPYEWAPEMLHAAGELTLDLAQSMLSGGIGLKDATPYNVLFRGPEPVFIDVLSFERRQPGDPTWLPYAQFVRTFLLPLLVQKHFGLGLDQLLTTRRDGIEPEEAYRCAGLFQRLKPPFLSLVSIPTWLGGRQNPDPKASIYRKKTLDDPAKAQYILETLLSGLRRSLAKVAPRTGRPIGLVGLHGLQLQLLDGSFCRQAAVCTRSAGRVGSQAGAGRRLQQRALQRHCGARGRFGGFDRLRPGGRGRCLAAGLRREAGHLAAGGEPGASHGPHRLAQPGVPVVSGTGAGQFRRRAHAGRHPPHAGHGAGSPGRHPETGR